MEQHDFKPDNSEAQAQEQKPDAELRLGASALSAANFDARHKEIVDSSFEKARQSGEKLPGQNRERRNYAYLSRLDKLVEKYGNEAEKRLWQQSIKDDLLIDYSNVPETYWNAKKQELRDNGYGNIDLTERQKHELIEKEREIQKESLEKWVNYLGDEHAPYPLWFKIYAWDGMTKMGKYNKGKGRYETRNNTTIAPYPNPDPEVLGSVFEVINRYYGNNEKEFYTEDGERNIELEEVVKSGNFPKIYNAIEHDIAPIIEPPEKAEDVHGSWIEYGPGDEDDIARAAKGTGWCVATPSVGRHYLEYGTYGDDDWDDDEEEHEEKSSSKAKFILFHIQNPASGKLSKNAVASIRLNPDGQVAEISGLKSGQALNDSLVSTVEEKVKMLPGGEKFLNAFADKQMLTRLDRKMQNGEKLTVDELKFLYEIDRPIKILDTYNDNDPRIYELRRKYQPTELLDYDEEMNIDNLTKHLSNKEKLENYNTLVERGASISLPEIAKGMNCDDVKDNIEKFIEYGANIDDIIPYVYHFSRDEFEDGLQDEDVKKFLELGADPDKLAEYTNIYSLGRNLDLFLSHGAHINSVIQHFDEYQIFKHLDTILEHGANIDEVVAHIHYANKKEIGALLEHGADIDNVVSHLESYAIYENYEYLKEHGADINNLASHLDNKHLEGYRIHDLLSNGADPNIFIPNMEPETIAWYLSLLKEHGASIDVEQLLSKLSPIKIIRYFDTLVENGATIDINKTLSELPNDSFDISKDIIRNINSLLAHGADIDIIVSKLDCQDLAYYVNELLNHGANVDTIVSKFRTAGIDPWLHREPLRDFLQYRRAYNQKQFE